MMQLIRNMQVHRRVSYLYSSLPTCLAAFTATTVVKRISAYLTQSILGEATGAGFGLAYPCLPITVGDEQIAILR